MPAERLVIAASARRSLLLEKSRGLPKTTCQSGRSGRPMPGRRADTVRLHLPLQAGRDGRWVLAIDDPLLERADGHLPSTHRLGNDQPFDQRPLKAHAHALELQLEAGRRRELLLRVRNDPSMVAPMGIQPGLVGLLDERHAQTAVTVLGSLPMMLALRPAIIQTRRGSATPRPRAAADWPSSCRTSTASSPSTTACGTRPATCCWCAPPGGRAT